MKNLFTKIGAILFTISVNAQTTLKIEPFRLGIGERKIITLNMDNFDINDATAFRCDIYLPEGIAIETNDYGKYNLSICDDGGRASTSLYSLYSSIQNDGAVRVVCFPPSPDKAEAKTLDQDDVQAFNGTSGALINIPLVASNSLSRSTEEVTIANQEITNFTGLSSVKPETSATNFLVFLRGDANMNGVVNGTDIQTAINLIVESKYNEDADVNEDKMINGTDIQGIINVIVHAE